MSKAESLRRILKAVSVFKTLAELHAKEDPYAAGQLIQKMARMEATINSALINEKLGLVGKDDRWDVDPYQTIAEIAMIIQKELKSEKARRSEKANRGAKPKLIEKASSDRATKLKKLKKIRHELADIMRED